MSCSCSPMVCVRDDDAEVLLRADRLDRGNEVPKRLADAWSGFDQELRFPAAGASPMASALVELLRGAPRTQGTSSR